MGETSKVLHLIATNFYGGPEKQILEHLWRINPSEFKGVICSFLENDEHNVLLEKARNSRIDTCAIPMKSTYDLRALFYLYREIRRNGIDLICAHGYKSIIMAHLVRKLTKTPVISFSRGYTYENRKVALYEWLERKVVGKQDGLVSVSQGQLGKLFALGVHPRRSWVVHNAVSVGQATEVRGKSDPLQTRNKLGVPAGAKMVVSSGRLSPEKGHNCLVDAIALLPEITNAVFVFCGDGVCLEKLKRQAAGLGVLDSCRFVGFRTDIMEIYNAMDLMVLPSLTEGLPNVVLEAFSFAKPVVAAAVGGVPELVENSVNGILFNSGDARAMAAAIQRCFDDPAWASALGKRGFEKVVSEFSFEQQNEKLMKIYKEVLGDG